MLSAIVFESEISPVGYLSPHVTVARLTQNSSPSDLDVLLFAHANEINNPGYATEQPVYW